MNAFADNTRRVIKDFNDKDVPLTITLKMQLKTSKNYLVDFRRLFQGGLTRKTMSKYGLKRQTRL